ncbi:hypothetical protein ABZ436_23410 [Micromonospora matsumotoense]|uniref:hypothetical protein n=1 Tax=Micromonospora matsumotoense TaxID=121616 RepID=UPI0033E2A241
MTRYGSAYTGYLAAKRRERTRWEARYAAEQEELEELQEAVRTTARAVNHARTITDNNKIGYDRYGGRVQRQISRRVRNAQQRLDELTRDQVRRPPMFHPGGEGHLPAATRTGRRSPVRRCTMTLGCPETLPVVGGRLGRAGGHPVRPGRPLRVAEIRW